MTDKEWLVLRSWINAYNLYINEYLVIKNTDGELVDKYKWMGKYRVIIQANINDFTGKIKPRNTHQDLL